MAEYLPFQGKHSIQEAQINILFLGPFDEQSIEVTRNFALTELSGELPRSAEARGRALQIDITDPSSPAVLEERQSDLVGFRFSRVQGNGLPARVLQLEGNTLSVSFMDYESWAAATMDTVRYMHPVLVSLPLELNPVVAVSIRFMDRFTFSGNPREAEASLLFSRGNPFIASHTFEAGPTWHCNTGWFEDVSQADDRVLHNLNVASNLVELSSTVTIDHHATRHLGYPRDTLIALFAPPTSAVGLTAALDGLHERNKGILRHILIPEMLAKIGMTE